MPKKPNPEGIDDDLIVCRCEGITLGEIRLSIRCSDTRTINQVKKLTRAGMGSCQGRTCANLVEMVLAADDRTSMGKEPYVSRPPVRGIYMDALASSADQFKEPTGPISAVMLRTPTTEQEVHPEPSKEINERYEKK